MTETKKEKIPQPQLEIRRIYTKDLSLETPGLKLMLKEACQPEILVDLDLNSQALEQPNFFEVILRMTVTAKKDDKTIFLIETHQVGEFILMDFPQDQQNHVLAVYCPSILFPYVRETVANLVSRTGLPQLNLAPINFGAIYAERIKQEKEKASDK